MSERDNEEDAGSGGELGPEALLFQHDLAAGGVDQQGLAGLEVEMVQGPERGSPGEGQRTALLPGQRRGPARPPAPSAAARVAPGAPASSSAPTPAR